MIDSEIVTAEELKELQDSVVKEIAEAIEFANASAYPELSSAVKDIYFDIVEEVRQR
jgi:pyruvate dehydrogenase E1 component alpha subunit